MLNKTQETPSLNADKRNDAGKETPMAKGCTSGKDIESSQNG